MTSSLPDRGAAAAPRNAGIDVLRGLAIVLVVMHHIGLRIPLKQGVLAEVLPAWAVSALIYNGFEAVLLFFVISGFLIATHSLQRWGRLAQIEPRRFYALRAARILPCLVLLLAVLSGLHLAGAADYVIAREGQSLPRALLAALGLHLNWYEGRTGYLPGNWDVLWSLSIEELFYLGFPLLCLALRRERALLLTLGLFALSLPAWRAALAGQGIWQEKATLPGMAAIATGVCAALIARRATPPRATTLRLLAALGGVALLAVLCCEGLLWRHLGNGSLLVLTCGSACLLLAFHWQAQGGAGAWLARGTSWLRAWGRLSYEIYLSHMFVVWPLVRAWKAAGGDLRWGILWYLPGLAAAWALGWAIARGFSEPAARWLRRRTGDARAALPSRLASDAA